MLRNNKIAAIGGSAVDPRRVRAAGLGNLDNATTEATVSRDDKAKKLRDAVLRLLVAE